MWVKVKEIVALAANKVVRAARSAAGDTNGLRVGEGGFECFMVDWSDAVWTKTNPKEDECGLNRGHGGVGGSDGTESVFVNV